MGKEGIHTFEHHTSEEFMTEKQESSSEHRSTLKKCPFCAELIQLEAIKCKHCGEFLNGFQRRDVKIHSDNKWYYSTGALVGMLLILGPLAIPAIWINPRYKFITKLFITITVILFTIFLVYLMVKLYSNLLSVFEV